MIIDALQTVLTIKFIVYLIAGSGIGMFVGAMPGLSAAMGVILILPLTFYMPTALALGLLVSLYMSCLCAGGLTAVYFNIPGTPQSVVTAIDGYPMTQKGKYSEAAGIVIGSSLVGGFISYTILSLSIAPLGEIAAKFGPLELFFTALLGVICAVSVRGKSPLKSLSSGLMGFLLGTMGMSPIGGTRATYGMLELMEGVPFIPVMIGMLAISMVLVLIEKETVVTKKFKASRSLRKLLSGIIYAWKKPIDLLFGSLIGTIVGIIPGEGATMASFLSYSRAKRFSKEKEKFGTGVPEGVIASETADNASTGGGLLTTLLLGIPGTGTCAVLLAALLLHGVEAGPMLLTKHTDVVYTLLSSLFIANIIMGIFAIIVAYYLGAFLFVPIKFLVPVIIVFCSVGAFIIRNSAMDVWLMYVFGLLGWVMRKHGYSCIALVIGLIVAPIADAELIRAVQIFHGKILGAIFLSPICIVLICLNVLLLLVLFRPSR